MGYILCKPFLNDTVVNEPTNDEAYLDIKYQMLLLEIKRINNDCQAGVIPDEDCKAQLSTLKKEAANLLRLLDLEPTELQNIFPNEDVLDQSIDDMTQRGDDYCPQCGELIEASDKFCMHCGHNL